MVLVPVQVEDNLPPPAPLALQQRPLHAETVHTGGDPVLQPSQVQEGGEPVSDVNQAEGERRFNIYRDPILLVLSPLGLKNSI